MPIFLMVLQALTLLPDLILGAERAFSGRKGSGKAKKKLVMTAAKAAVDASKGTPAEKKLVMATVSKAVNSTVKTINAVNAIKQ
jgi:hypothetical protein